MQDKGNQCGQTQIPIHQKMVAQRIDQLQINSLKKKTRVHLMRQPVKNTIRTIFGYP
jgi:hypothetical protein